MILPEHMTVWDRNQRLYETLKGMGLHTEAIPCPDDPTKIDSVVVAAAPPTAPLQITEIAEHGASARRVGPPMQGAKVDQGIAPATSGGENVVDFPTIV